MTGFHVFQRNPTTKAAGDGGNASGISTTTTNSAANANIGGGVGGLRPRLPPIDGNMSNSSAANAGGEISFENPSDSSSFARPAARKGSRPDTKSFPSPPHPSHGMATRSSPLGSPPPKGSPLSMMNGGEPSARCSARHPPSSTVSTSEPEGRAMEVVEGERRRAHGAPTPASKVTSSSSLGTGSPLPPQRQLSPLLARQEYLCAVHPPGGRGSPPTGFSSASATTRSEGTAPTPHDAHRHHPSAQRFLVASKAATLGRSLSAVKKEKHTTHLARSPSMAPSLVSTIPPPPPLASSYSSSWNASTDRGGDARDEANATPTETEAPHKGEVGAEEGTALAPRSPEQEELLALKSVLTHTTNRMAYLKEITPEVDVSRILAPTPIGRDSLATAARHPTGIALPKGSQKGDGNAEPNRVVDASHATKSSLSAATTTRAVGQHPPQEEGTAVRSHGVAATTTNPPRWPFGAAPLSTAERARRARAAQQKRAKQGEGATSSASTADLGYKEAEEEEDVDVEAVLNAMPSAPSINLKGSRYFIARLARGTHDLFRSPSTSPAGGGGTRGSQGALGASATSPTGKQRGEEEAEDAEVEALYRRLLEQEQRLNNRFKDLHHHWMNLGKEEESLDWEHDGQHASSTSAGRSVSAAACRKGGHYPSIPPGEPSVFAAETDDEVREKAAAADEFVKNHNNRRRRQQRLQMARRQKTLLKEKMKKEEEEAARKRKQNEEEEGATGSAPHSTTVDGKAKAGEDGLMEPLTPTATSGLGATGNSISTSHSSGIISDGALLEEMEDSGMDEENLELDPFPKEGKTEEEANAQHAGDQTKRKGSERSGSGPAGRGPGKGEDGKTLHASSTPPPPRSLNIHLTGDGATAARLGMASSSMSSPVLAEAAMAIMGMLENRADVILPSPSETTQCRQGDVLSGAFMLKLDLQDALRNRTGPTGMIAGAPYFRIVPKFNIAGVAQANVSAIKTILNELRRAHIEAPIIWVNLREEPLVYIHNNAHIVRERAHPLEPIIIPNATGRSIEMVENKLKTEVLAEARANGGNISICAEGKDGIVEDQWISASPQSVCTTQEVFSSISCSTYGRSQLQYYRWPITQNVGPQPEHFDFVLEACLEEPKAVFIFNCQTGRGRTSAMMQIANIVRFYQFCVKDVAVDGRLLRSAIHGPKFKTIQQLISLLPDGKLHQRRVFTLMDLADKVYSMADHITDAFEHQESDPEVAMMRLQQYAYFLVFSFYCEQRLWNFQIKDSFADWLTANAEIKRLILGVREKLSEQLREERIGEDAPSDMDGKTLHIIRHRAGNVLSSGRILCSMAVQKEAAPKDLRQLAPGVPLFTCGRMSDAVAYKFLEEMKKAFPNHRTIHWLSVRAEPHVVINGVHYTICDVTTVPGEADVGTSMHVSLKAMEQLEDRLRRDVLLESQENKGSILVHQISESGERKALFVKVIHVKTPKSVMEEFSQKSGAQYIRIPVPFVNHMITADIDPLLRFLSETECHKQDVFVINDSDGGTRASVVLNILTLYRASRFAPLRALQSTRDITQTLKCTGDSLTDSVMPMAAKSMNQHISNCTHVPERRVEVLLASTICQMLTAGSLLKTMDAVMDLGGVGKEWNILHYLDHLKSQIGVMGRSKPQCIQTALRGLRSYLEVLLVSLYLDHNGDFTPSMPFNTWVSLRKEVFNILNRLDARGENALKYVNAENLMKADVSRRSGDVLTANFCLKADHFPGCQKQGLRPALCGAPNFRKVNLVNVYGVAITTLVGLHNVLALLGASEEPLLTYPGQRNDTELYLGFAAPRLFDPAFKPEELRRPLRGSCLWINLREEPILYVGDRPFVFRDLAAPYVNVELTGIETKKIEHVENQLKVDVLNEADMYNGKFLVHDEAQPGELVGIWEDASEDTVKTTREVYNEVVSKGYRCMMLRLPVTDEQSPEIRDFDLMVNALLPSIAAHMDRRETLSFVFNCQMGRGRTTTGMVICCLLIGLVIPEYFTELHNYYYQSLNDESLSEMSKGNYAIVNQLKRVLLNGRKAKDRVDLVLEACSKMQNLRTAIENFVTVQQSPDFTEGQRARAHHAGIHYLVRYFNLIVFAVYLEEEYNRMQKKMRCTFEEWMLEHPEITTIAQTASLV